MNARIELHERTLDALISRLASHGLATERMPFFRSPFDVLVEKKIRVELKTSTISKHGIIEFTIGRHGKTFDAAEAHFVVCAWPGGEAIMPSSPLHGRKAFGFVARPKTVRHCDAHIRLAISWADFIERLRARAKQRRHA